MKILIRIIFILLLLIMPTYISIKYGFITALINIACIIVAALLSEGGGIDYIEIRWLKIKLQNKLEEAASLLAQLRKMAEIHGESIVTMLACSQLSFMQKLDFSYVEKLINKTNNLMKDLEIYRQAIRNINDLWIHINAQKYVQSLFNFDKLTEDGKREAEEIISLTKIEISNVYVKKVQTFLDKHNQQYDISIFENFKHFIETGEHKACN